MISILSSDDLMEARPSAMSSVERKHRRRKPSKIVRARDDYFPPKILTRQAKVDPRSQVRVGHVRRNLMTNLAIWLGPKQKTSGFSDQMTRGRRKDTTLPPSRALVIQRAYRDRKARHLADLEERCRKAEEENERLRKELELARSESAVGSINIELVNRGGWFLGEIRSA